MEYLLISDTHGELEKTKEIIKKYPNLDGYFHLGDIGFDVQYLKNFYIIKGNHDKNLNFPKEYILNLGKYRVLCIHGDCMDNEIAKYIENISDVDQDIAMQKVFQVYYDKLSLYVKSKKCNVVFFGHTHAKCFAKCNNVFLINPGSICFGMNGVTYAIVSIDKKRIDVNFINI